MYRAGSLRRGYTIICHVQHGLPTQTISPLLSKVTLRTSKVQLATQVRFTGGEKIHVKKFMFDDVIDPVDEDLRVYLGVLDNLVAEPEVHRSASIKSVKFSEVIDQLKCSVEKLPTADFVQCLGNLRVLYPDEDPEIMRTMDDYILSVISDVPLPQLCELIWSHKHNIVTNQRQQTVQAAKDEVLRRTPQINDPKILVSMLWIADENSIAQLEAKMLEIIDQLNIKQIYRMLRFLSYHKRRNTPLIRGLVSNFNFKSSGTTVKLTLPHLLSLVESCAELSIYNEALLEHWSKAMCLLLENPSMRISVNNICSCAKSMRRLRWNDRTLIDLLAGKVMMKNGDISDNLLSQVLGLCAMVNYLPPELEMALPQICSVLTEEYMMKEPRTFVEIVWSLTCLGVLVKSKLQPVGILEAGFIQHLKASSSERVWPTLCVKLMNISTDVCCEMSNHHHGLPDDFLASHSVKVPIPKQQLLLNKAKAALSNMYPAKFLKFNAESSFGYVIDIEMLLNTKGEPQPLNSDNSNLKKLAVKILDYSDMTLNQEGPIGRHTMMKRHLQYAGYTVIMVPFLKLVELDTTAKYIKYLTTELEIKNLPK